MTYPVIGAIILAVIRNGLELISISQTMVFVITGIVLLGAVTVDSLARKSQTLLE